MKTSCGTWQGDSKNWTKQLNTKNRLGTPGKHLGKRCWSFQIGLHFLSCYGQREAHSEPMAALGFKMSLADVSPLGGKQCCEEHGEVVGWCSHRAKAIGCYVNRTFRTACLLHIVQKHQIGIRSLTVKRMNSKILECMAEFLHDVMKAKACKTRFF